MYIRVYRLFEKIIPRKLPPCQDHNLDLCTAMSFHRLFFHVLSMTEVDTCIDVHIPCTDKCMHLSLYIDTTCRLCLYKYTHVYTFIYWYIPCMNKYFKKSKKL